MKIILYQMIFGVLGKIFKGFVWILKVTGLWFFFGALILQENLIIVTGPATLIFNNAISLLILIIWVYIVAQNIMRFVRKDPQYQLHTLFNKNSIVDQQKEVGNP